MFVLIIGVFLMLYDTDAEIVNGSFLKLISSLNVKSTIEKYAESCGLLSELFVEVIRSIEFAMKLFAESLYPETTEITSRSFS